MVQQLCRMDLKKYLSVSETLDWVKVLVLLNVKSIDWKTLESTLTILVKHETDVMRAKRGLERRASTGGDDGDDDDGDLGPGIRRLPYPPRSRGNQTTDERG